MKTGDLSIFGPVSPSTVDRTPCPLCQRSKPTSAEWATVPEGGRPDLCWDTDGGDCQTSRRAAPEAAPVETLPLFARAG